MKFFRFLGRPESRPTPKCTGPRKWVPIIDTDSCGGCGKCLKACAPRCIDLVWAFATLARPGECDSCGQCEAVCPEDVIRMDWSELEGDAGIGRWESGPTGDPRES